MRIVEVTVTLSRKINLGNYESTDHFISAKAELVDGTLTEFADTYTKLASALERKMDEWVKSKKGEEPE